MQVRAPETFQQVLVARDPKVEEVPQAAMCGAGR